MYIPSGLDVPLPPFEDPITITIKSPLGAIEFDARVDEHGWYFSEGRGLREFTIGVRATSEVRWTPALPGLRVGNLSLEEFLAGHHEEVTPPPDHHDADEN